MQPIEVVQIEGSDMFKAIALWEDAVRQQLQFPGQEEWRLVNVIVQPVMKQVSQGVITMGGQPQMEMAVAVIGFFQRKEDVDVLAITANTMDNAFKEMGFEKGIQGVREKILRANCTHDELEDGICTRCGYSVISGE